MIKLLLLCVSLLVGLNQARAEDLLSLENHFDTEVSGSADALALSHDSLYVMALYDLYTGEQFVQFYNIETKKISRQINGVLSGALSPISDDFVYWSKVDGTVHRINFKTEAEYPPLAGLGKPYYSPSAKYLALVNDHEIVLFDGQTYKRKPKHRIIEQPDKLQWFQFDSTSNFVGYVLESKQKMDEAFILDRDLNTVWRMPVDAFGQEYSQLFLHLLPKNRVLIVASNACRSGDCPDAIAKTQIWDFQNNKKIQDVDFGVRPIYIRSMTEWTEKFHVLWDAGLCILSTNEGGDDLLHFFKCENMQKLGQTWTGGNLMNFSLLQSARKLITNLFSYGGASQINVFSFEKSLIGD